MAPLEISMLGTLQIRRDGLQAVGFASNKVRALLAYLVLESDRPQRRETLAGLLWPDSPQDSAFASLRNALANLRAAIGDREAEPPYLLIEREDIQFNLHSRAWVDTLNFQTTATLDSPPYPLERMQAAVALYRGPLLEGFSLPDSSPFEEWLIVRREQLAQLALSLLRQVSDELTAREDYEQALVYACRQVELEPWLEESHRQIMNLYMLRGQRSNALVQFAKARRALQDELNVEPGLETRRLYEHIRAGTWTAPPYRAKAIGVTTQPAKLPRQPNRLIGREQEISTIIEKLTQNRLVTLTGPGGAGKSRLALAAAERIQGRLVEEAYWVDLAPLSDAEKLADRIANQVNLRLGQHAGWLDALVGFFRSRSALLVLDNCEHLAQACAQLVEKLLQTTPRLHLLATSRIRLEAQDETVFQTPGLSLPEADDAQILLETMENSEAVALFLERVHNSSPGFTLNRHNALAVAEICRRLDGYPLAIELAAMRAQTLDVTHIAARLGQALSLLSSSFPDLPLRQRGLRATLDWSYGLLAMNEQEVLQNLSVFGGNFSLEAVESVGAATSTAGGEVFDSLLSLVEKSLLQTITRPGSELRYRLLEPVRQYASEKLHESGRLTVQQERHLAYYLELAERLEQGLRGPELPERLEKLETELDNLRLALEWATSRDPQRAVRLAGALMWFWHIRNSHRLEGITWLEKTLKAEETHRLQPLDRQSGVWRAKALSALAFQLRMQRQNEPALAALEESQNILNTYAPDETLWKAWNLFLMAYCAFFQNDRARMVSFLQDSLKLYERLGELNRIGDIYFVLGDLETDPTLAEQHYRQGLAYQEASGDPDGIATLHQGLGQSAYMAQRYEDAVKHFSSSMREYAAIGNDWGVANQLRNLGWSYWYLGEYEKASDNFTRAAAIYDRNGDDGYHAICLCYLAQIAISKGDYTAARLFLAEVIHLGREVNFPAIVADACLILGRLHWLCGEKEIAAEQIDEGLRLEASLTDDWGKESHGPYFAGWLSLQRGDVNSACAQFIQGIKFFQNKPHWLKFGLMVEGLGYCFVNLQDFHSAVKLLAASHQLFPQIAPRKAPDERRQHEAALLTCRQALGEVQFNQDWEMGSRMSAVEALTIALTQEPL